MNGLPMTLVRSHSVRSTTDESNGRIERAGVVTPDWKGRKSSDPITVIGVISEGQRSKYHQIAPAAIGRGDKSMHDCSSLDNANIRTLIL